MAKARAGRHASRLARSVEVAGAVDLALLPAPELRAMASAASEYQEILRLLRKSGDNVVGELLRGQGTFYEWDHYPPGDVYDPDSGAQYYYHAHAMSERMAGEHGHFHTFVRPVPGLAGLCHLVAVAMNDEGEPFRLFTVNRWVTDETWYPAPVAIELLDRFQVDLTRPSWVANRWLGACLTLFRPQIVALIEARDRVLAAWGRRHPQRDVFEDRELEVISVADVSPEEQLHALHRALSPTARRRAG